MPPKGFGCPASIKMKNNSCPALNGQSPNCSTRWKPSWLMHGHLSPQHLTSLTFYFQQTWLMMSNETLADPLPSPQQLISCRLPAPLSGEGDEGTEFVCKLENDVQGSLSIMIKAFKKTPDKCSSLLFHPCSMRTFETEGKFSVAICTEGMHTNQAAANWIQGSNWSLTVAPWAAPASPDLPRGSATQGIRSLTKQSRHSGPSPP